MKNKVPENPIENRIGSFNALTVVTAILVTLYLTANLMAVKIIKIGPVALFDAGTITFPFTYMLGDVLAEVWGYKTAKHVIFTTFITNIMLVVFTSIGAILPYPEYMEEIQSAYVTIYTYVPRIVLASLIAFLIGELLNAKVLVAMRNKRKDSKKLWARTIGSSAVAYIADSTLFVLIAFSGTVPVSDLFSMIVLQYFAKLIIEAIFGTPLAYLGVWFLRRK